MLPVHEMYWRRLKIKAEKDDLVREDRIRALRMIRINLWVLALLIGLAAI